MQEKVEKKVSMKVKKRKKWKFFFFQRVTREKSVCVNFFSSVVCFFPHNFFCTGVAGKKQQQIYTENIKKQATNCGIVKRRNRKKVHKIKEKMQIIKVKFIIIN